MNLSVEDEIHVTKNHSMQLCFGSLTKVINEKKVDVLVVSAYPDDYRPTRGSLIGALKSDLLIDLQELATDKGEDLRNSCSCWWTKELPPSCPYSKILCFEGSYKHGKAPPQVVGDVFRALALLCNEDEFSVAMPLLATGDQGYSKTYMLKLLTETAFYWIKIGLPLHLLKLVVYDTKDQASIVSTFQELKSSYIHKCQLSSHIVSMQKDLYLCYSQADEDMAQKICAILHKIDSSVKICLPTKDVSASSGFQHDIYNMMVSCVRALVLLTPNFIADSRCLEEYNMALCCNRVMDHEYLLPLYMNEIQNMPTYMKLVQFIDLTQTDRMSKNCEVVCRSIVNWLKVNKDLMRKRETFHYQSLEELQQAVQSSEEGTVDEFNFYDIFISYSHQDQKVANLLLKNLKAIRPDWNIFFDVTGLRTGCSWQMKLYEAIEKSVIFVCLTSSNYLQSKICQEEFNLALALHRDRSFKTTLMQLGIEAVGNLPAWCRDIPCFDYSRLVDSSDSIEIRALVKAADLLLGSELAGSEKTLSIKPLMSSWRKLNHKKHYPFLTAKTVSDDKMRIFLSYHAHQKSYALFLEDELKALLPGAIISCRNCENTSDRKKMLEESDLIIPFLSTMYVNDSGCMEELNTAFMRQRWCDALMICPVTVESLPLNPAYPNLCFCLFSFTDDYWMETYFEKPRKNLPIDPPKATCLIELSKFVARVTTNPLTEGSVKSLLNVNEIELSIGEMMEFSHEFFDGGTLNPLCYDTAEEKDSVNVTTHNKQISASEMDSHVRRVPGHGSSHCSGLGLAGEILI